MSKFVKIRISSSGAGQNLAGYLARAGYPIHADCGGHGKCGKCRVRLDSGVLFANPECTRPAVPDADGWYYACRVYGGHGAIVLLPVQDGDGLTDFAGSTVPGDKAEMNSSLGIARGIALDIGTTTLAMALVSVPDGQVLATTSELNPQKAFGADVISRIGACMQDSTTLPAMQSLLLDRVRDMMHRLLGDKRAERMTVAGNTTMLHILCGVSPTSMGAYPFTPVFTDTKTLSGSELDLPVDTLTLLPSISAFVGGDITAGILACKLTDSDAPTMLIDVGTNGEAVLYTGRLQGGALYAASAAAGPALEGAGISSGVGGIRGAVCAVECRDGRFVCRTVQDAPPIGICGSGLLDLVSLLYEHGHMDETGLLMADRPFTYATGEQGALTLTQEDVRALQLAKSAIRAGVEALCAHAGLTPRELGTVYLAGGLGYYMNVNSAIAIGLLPPEVRDCVQSVGNSALGGAVQLLCDPTLADGLQSRADACQTLELNTNAVWNAAFMEHMMFPYEEDDEYTAN